MKRSYSLEEVAAAHLPAEWDGVRWLSRRLYSGELRGFLISRSVWRMTDEDVDYLIDKHRREPVQKSAPVAAEAFPLGLSARSSRRLRSTTA